MAILPDFVQALYRGVDNIAGILSGGEKLHGRAVTVIRLVKRKGRGFHERRDKAAVLMFTPKFFSTTGGIAADIYLTNHPGYAAYMANKEAMFKKADNFVVYEIEVEDSLLEPDMDELIYVSQLSETEAKKCTLIQSLSLSRSCRAPHDLYIGKEVIRKVAMPSSFNKVASDLMPTKNIICLRRENQESLALEILDQVGWVSLTV